MALVRRGRCVQSVGAGLLDCPAVGSYRYNQAQANPSPGTRAGGDACPYERKPGGVVFAGYGDHGQYTA